MAETLKLKILVVGDSHCWDLGYKINERFGNEFTAIALSRGRSISLISEVFIRDLPSTLEFEPDITILHAGHNDLTYHHYLNKYPKLSKPTAVETIELANLIQSYLPKTLIFLSAVFPRTPAYDSTLSEENTIKYNKVAKRHGLRIRTMANFNGYYSFLNNCMWRVVSNAQEEESLFFEDGLHLTDAGKSTVIDGWIKDIRAELARIAIAADLAKNRK
jgi:lysophospholipase L1-like esterase